MKAYVYIIFLTCLLIEILSFSIVLQKNFSSEKNLIDNFKQTINLHPFFNNQTIEYGFFDPLLTQRYIPNTTTGNMKINSHGFIGNGHNNDLLNSFPEKPEKFFRIFMLGGSSLAGNAMNRGNKYTISAYLENFLNTKLNNEKQFQVFNYGISGGWSFSEMRRFFSEIIHFEPDMIISLDGWNDAVKTNFIADSNNLDLGLLNWDQLSYLYFDFYNGFDSPKPPFIFTYSYILVNYFNFMDTIKKKNRKKLYSQHHLSAQTSYLKKKYSELDFVLFKNLDAISSYSENNNIFHLIYLQPYAEKNRKLIFEEQKLLDEHHRKSVIYNGELWKRNIYKSLMEETYNNYEMYLSKFNQKYLNQNLINSFNITKIFENVDEIVYLDAIHYNFRGNEIIAKKIFEDIERILSSD